MVMQFLIYALAYPILLIISVLPFRLLYLFSDLVCFIVYNLIGYRKKTVTSNLKLVFPEKSKNELISIRRKFYKHLCDMFLEMIKSISVSKAQISKRFVLHNPEEFQRLEKLGKSIIVIYGHYASYEWSMVMEDYMNFPGYGVYKKIKNSYFDKLVKRIRSKYNTVLITTKEVKGLLRRFKNEDKKFAIGFVADQSPKLSTKNHWTTFMGIKVPAFVGAEVFAKKMNYSMTYLKIDKVKRGYYEAELVTLADNATEHPDFQLTDKFHEILGNQIKARPEHYLWTHKRWKHKDKYDVITSKS